MTLLELHIERAVAGGRMLARHDGVVVLVSGAIPGEKVRARVEKRTRSLLWARTVEVLEPSPSRRVAQVDPACGGLDYAHIEYEAQLRCKEELILDALRRIGHLAVDASVPVAPSEPSGYRLRARLHVQAGRAGFLRAGTHELCDAAPSGQLRIEALVAARETLTALGDRADDVTAVVVAENIAATERVLHLECREDRDLSSVGSRLEGVHFITGLTTVARGRLMTLVGVDHVADTAEDLFGVDSPVPAGTRWMRRPTSFFQGNRFLIGRLVRHVLAHASGTRVLDLYAGVGLFATAFAAVGRPVMAVEGDASAAGDLETNAKPWSSLHVVHASVEDALRRVREPLPDTVVLDPPRTGASPQALEGVLACRAGRLVYVSCDPPTLARDAATLVAGGYRLVSLYAFDLFPDTAHVETVAVFDASSR